MKRADNPDKSGVREPPAEMMMRTKSVISVVAAVLAAVVCAYVTVEFLMRFLE